MNVISDLYRKIESGLVKNKRIRRIIAGATPDRDEKFIYTLSVSYHAVATVWSTT
jgi:hypothetical protein